MAPQLISGNINKLDPDALRRKLQEAGITRIDTAPRYMNGESEKTLGKAKFPETFDIDTKILIQLPRHGHLSPDAIEKSLLNSLHVLGVEKVNVLYCHGPDHTTPIAEQARAFHQHHTQGRFSQLGVSNFSPSMLEEWLSVAEKEGLVKPTVYQGQYNLLCRGYETTLFPLLRKYNISFIGFSPVAGGFLLGNLTPEGVQGGSRFVGPGPGKRWYDKASMHEAIRRLKSISKRTGIGMDELSLRWLAHHSILQDHDGILLGASQVEQISNNVAQIRKGHLDADVAAQLTALWEVCKDESMDILDYGP